MKTGVAGVVPASGGSNHEGVAANPPFPRPCKNVLISRELNAIPNESVARNVLYGNWIKPELIFARDVLTSRKFIKSEIDSR